MTIIQYRELKRDRPGPTVRVVTFLDGHAHLCIDDTGYDTSIQLSRAEVGRLAEIFSESGLAAIKCEVAATAVREMEASDQVTA